MSLNCFHSGTLSVAVAMVVSSDVNETSNEHKSDDKSLERHSRTFFSSEKTATPVGNHRTGEISEKRRGSRVRQGNHSKTKVRVKQIEKEGERENAT